MSKYTDIPSELDHINWHALIYRMSATLVSHIVCRKDFRKSHLPPVLIDDDSNLPKTGLRMEAIGRIFSHVHRKCILGYKAPMLCWSDGRTQFALDFSQQGENGKKQGMTAGQRKRRYGREQDSESHAVVRIKRVLHGQEREVDRDGQDSFLV